MVVKTPSGQKNSLVLRNSFKTHMKLKKLLMCFLHFVFVGDINKYNRTKVVQYYRDLTSPLHTLMFIARSSVTKSRYLPRVHGCNRVI